MTQSPYSHYSPYRTKSSGGWDKIVDALTPDSAKPTITDKALMNWMALNNITGNDAVNYGMSGVAGGLGGAGIGALIQALRGKSIGKGALIGGGIGGLAGLGQKYLSESQFPVMAPALRGAKTYSG